MHYQDLSGISRTMVQRFWQCVPEALCHNFKGGNDYFGCFVLICSRHVLLHVVGSFREPCRPRMKVQKQDQ